MYVVDRKDLGQQYEAVQTVFYKNSRYLFNINKFSNMCDFIEKANLIHNNKYDYSKVSYIDWCTKVKIICPIHGEFEQIPNNHLKGCNCPKCGNIIRNDILRKSLFKFIVDSQNIHKFKYDYSKVYYQTTHKKVIIICPIHGEFEQSPSHHINGSGCPYCSGCKHNNKTFIDKAELVHGYKYDYSLVNYINKRIPVKIICPIHGEFEQKPDYHLRGSGCQICNESKGEKQIKKFLISNDINFIKYKIFENCVDLRVLPFDFYLPDLNTCIEYDGRQHFEVVNEWGGEEGLKDRVKKDKIKTDYCNDNGIKLIRITYKDNIINKLNIMKET